MSEFDYDDYKKVSSALTGTMHLSAMTDGFHTLCGRWWHLENNHGDVYCRTCQSILSKRVRLFEEK